MEPEPSAPHPTYIDQQVYPEDPVLDLSKMDDELILCRRDGLHQVGDMIFAKRAGKLRFSEPNMYWIESSHKQYVPKPGDNDVLGIVVLVNPDHFVVDIKGPRLAYLPSDSFEGVTKGNIPKFEMGTLLYLRVVSFIGKCPEVSCMDASGKAADYGPLKDGLMFECSTGLSRTLLRSPCAVLETLGKEIPFEIVVGLNGRVWVNAPSSSIIVLVANAILKTESLSLEQQKFEVERLIRARPV